MVRVRVFVLNLLLWTVIATHYVQSNPLGLVVPNKNGTWYSLKVSNPVVLQLGPKDYRMWAYGRDTDYKGSPVVSFGRTGAFCSTDGITWTPIVGPDALGSVMAGNSSCGQQCFDSSDVGVTDVLYSPSQGIFYMWYMGTRQQPNHDQPAFGLIPATRGGIAVSYDGTHWAKCSGPKAYGSWLEATPGIDAYMFLMTIYPRYIGPDGRPTSFNSSSTTSQATEGRPLLRSDCNNTSSVNARSVNASNSQKCNAVVPDCSKLLKDAQQLSRSDDNCRDTANKNSALCEFKMFYNSASPVNGSTTKPVPPDQLLLKLFGAVGTSVFNFTKTGAVVTLGPSVANPLAPDSASTGSARVLALPSNTGFLLFYEGVNRTSHRYSILLARSTDGQTWLKDVTCTGWPGGPVLEPGQGDDAWDYYVGTPFPLLQPDGRIFLYYVGFPKPKSTTAQEGPQPAQIGLAVGHVNNPCMFVKYSKTA